MGRLVNDISWVTGDAGAVVCSLSGSDGLESVEGVAELDPASELS